MFRFSPDRGEGKVLGVTDAITDFANNGDSLIKNAKNGKIIYVGFQIKPDNGKFNYEGREGTSIGSMTMSIRVNPEKASILEQSMQAMLANANRQTEGILTLLQR